MFDRLLAHTFAANPDLVLKADLVLDPRVTPVRQLGRVFAIYCLIA